MRRYARFLLDNALVDPHELAKVFPRRIERDVKVIDGGLKAPSKRAKKTVSSPARKSAKKAKKRTAKKRSRGA